MPKVSIIISNRNDVAMLAVTVRSCIEELKPLGAGAGEIVIADNSDEGIYKLIGSALPTGYCQQGLLKIHRQDFPCLFTARELAAEKAKGKYIICVDSHCIIGRDIIVHLVNFMESKEDDPTLGFAHAPVNWAHQHERASRHDRDMTTCELGNWNSAYKTERMINFKGMPWICRRDWFLDRDKGLNAYGALSEHKLSWGGGDMHIGIKPWLLGFKNWAVPCSPAIHIGPFPKIDRGKDPNHVNVDSSGHKYRLWGESGVGPHAIGFLVSCYVLGGEFMMERNRATIKERFGRYIDLDKWWDKAIEYGKDEKSWLDERKVTSFGDLLKDKPWNGQDN